AEKAVLVGGSDQLHRKRELEDAHQNPALDLSMEVGTSERRTLSAEAELLSVKREVDVALENPRHRDLQKEMTSLVHQVEQRFDHRAPLPGVQTPSDLRIESDNPK